MTSQSTNYYIDYGIYKELGAMYHSIFVWYHRTMFQFRTNYWPITSSQIKCVNISCNKYFQSIWFVCAIVTVAWIYDACSIIIWMFNRLDLFDRFDQRNTKDSKNDLPNVKNIGKGEVIIPFGIFTLSINSVSAMDFFSFWLLNCSTSIRIACDTHINDLFIFRLLHWLTIICPKVWLQFHINEFRQISHAINT